ncbi:molybdate ABC transporter substrate-binding protein [Salinispira pacifica]
MAALVLTLLVPVIGAAQERPQTIRVAAAANLSFLEGPLTAAFEKSAPSLRVQFSFASSGALTAQILSGAPFDLFMSADTSYPEKVEAAGLAAGAPSVYAIGRLVLFSTRRLDLSRGLDVLRDPSVRTIAVANPQTAPYGKAAMEVLSHAGLDGVRSKLVYSQSIAQVVQYTLTGADVGFINQSALFTHELAPYAKQGVNWIPINPSLYSPVTQAFVLLRDSKHPEAARSFARFLLSPAAQAIFDRYGYGSP